MLKKRVPRLLLVAALLLGVLITTILMKESISARADSVGNPLYSYTGPGTSQLLRYTYSAPATAGPLAGENEVTDVASTNPFYVLPNQLPGTTPLQKCNGDVYYDTTCYPLQANAHGPVVGYIYSSSQHGTVPLYRCVNVLVGISTLTEWDSVLNPGAECFPNSHTDVIGYVYASDKSGSSTHLVTTAGTGNGFTLDLTIANLFNDRQAGTIPLYGCFFDGNHDAHFVSLDAGCQGQTGDDALGLKKTLGYLYDPGQTQPANTSALYLCVGNNAEYSAGTAASGCQGLRQDIKLGYAPNTTNGGSHWTTTGAVAAGWNRGDLLGYAYSSNVYPDNAGVLYGCYRTSNPQDHYVGLNSDCGGGTGDDAQGGQKVLGYVFKTPPPNIPSFALYRCALGEGDHFVAHDANCGGVAGATSDLLLGYALQNPPQP